MTLAVLLSVGCSGAASAVTAVGHGCPDGAPEAEQFDADRLEGLRYERAKRTAKRHECTLRVVKIGPAPLPVTDDYVPNRINVALRLDGRVAKVTGIH